MKKQLIPFYISRAIISAVIGYAILLNNEVWVGILMGIATLAGFIWYAHSGRYLINPDKPLTPLQRDDRGKEIRNRALVIAVGIAGSIYGASALLGMFYSMPNNMGSWALIAGVVVYFAISNWMHIRDNS